MNLYKVLEYYLPLRTIVIKMLTTLTNVWASCMSSLDFFPVRAEYLKSISTILF